MSGLITELYEAYKAPATPANTALIVKLRSFFHIVLMPSDSAKFSSWDMAMNVLPIKEWTSRWHMKSMTMRKKRVK